jgi:hypothetical protein
VAEELGFDAVGTVSVLEFAVERNLLDLKLELNALRATTFYISEEYIEAALKRRRCTQADGANISGRGFVVAVLCIQIVGKVRELTAPLHYLCSAVSSQHAAKTRDHCQRRAAHSGAGD